MKPNKENKYCSWTNEYEGSDYWSTSCGNEFIIIEGTPTENDFKFCVYCGNALKECDSYEESDDKG